MFLVRLQTFFRQHNLFARIWEKFIFEVHSKQWLIHHPINQSTRFMRLLASFEISCGKYDSIWKIPSIVRMWQTLSRQHNSITWDYAVTANQCERIHARTNGMSVPSMTSDRCQIANINISKWARFSNALFASINTMTNPWSIHFTFACWHFIRIGVCAEYLKRANVFGAQ